MDDTTSVEATLVFLLGPPAVGKMTVGQALARQTGFALFHLHQVVDLLTDYFPFGSPSFSRLSRSYRTEFFAEAAASGLNLITTGGWIFDRPQGKEIFWRFVRPYVERGHRVCFVELNAPLEALLARNRTENRRRRKKTEWATDDHLRQLVTTHRWVSEGAFPLDLPHLRLDTEHLAAEAAAHTIAGHLGLRTMR